MFKIKQTCVPVRRKAKGQFYFATQKETAGGWKSFVEVKDSQTRLKRGQCNVITLFPQETCDVTGCTKLCS